MSDLEDCANPGTQIVKVIRNEIYNNIMTACLAEVTNVKTNKAKKAVVDVKLLNTGTYNGKTVKAQEVKSLPVGIMGVKGWTFNLPIDKGDIGLCIACKWDISGYMEDGKSGKEPKTTRTYNLGDSIFIPLSMYLQPEIIKKNFVITETSGDKPKVKITLQSDGVIEVENKDKITVTSDGELTVKHKKKIDISTEDELNVSSDKDMKITGKGKLDIKASKDITFNSQGKLDISVTNDATLKSSSKVTIDCSSINIGNGATSPVVLGDQLLQYLTNLTTWLGTHTHMGNMGVLTSPPQAPLPPIPSSSMNSTSAMVK